MGAVAAYFVLTFVFSWAVFLGSARAVGGMMPADRVGLTQWLVLPGVFAPAAAGLFMSWWANGRDGVFRLLRRLARPEAPVWLWVVALSFMAVVKLMVAAVYRGTEGGWLAFGTESVLVMLAATAISTPVQAGEEIGWRGYALPRMAERMGLPLASIVLGVIWASWHLPLFFMAGADTQGQSFPLYLLQVTALSVAAAWIFMRAGGKLLPVMVMHAAVNNTKDIVPSATTGASDPFSLQASTVGWLTVALLWVCAAVFLAQMRGRTIPSGVVITVRETA